MSNLSNVHPDGVPRIPHFDADVDFRVCGTGGVSRTFEDDLLVPDVMFDLNPFEQYFMLTLCTRSVRLCG